MEFLTNVQGAVFYPLLSTMGILIPDTAARGEGDDKWAWGRGNAEQACGVADK
jgi:hypothetical protein